MQSRGPCFSGTLTPLCSVEYSQLLGTYISSGLELLNVFRSLTIYRYSLHDLTRILFSLFIKESGEKSKRCKSRFAEKRRAYPAALGEAVRQKTTSESTRTLVL